MYIACAIIVVKSPVNDKYIPFIYIFIQMAIMFETNKKWKEIKINP